MYLIKHEKNLFLRKCFPVPWTYFSLPRGNQTTNKTKMISEPQSTGKNAYGYIFSILLLNLLRQKYTYCELRMCICAEVRCKHAVCSYL